jgi:hypothetical protein
MMVVISLAEQDSDGKGVRMGFMNTRLGVLCAYEYAEKTSSLLDDGTQREGVGARGHGIGSWSTIFHMVLPNMIPAVNDLGYELGGVIDTVKPE